MKKISFVLPVYNEEEGVEEFFTELDKECQKHKEKYDFEFIFINDGSKDSSPEKLTSLHNKDSRIKVINFARNFGHQIAISAGLDYVEADAAIIMDTDLQDPPSVAFQLIEKWEEGFEVVYAQRKTRKDSFFKKLTAQAFYRILKNMTEVNIPVDTGDFRLVDKKAIEAINKFREHSRFMRGLFSYIGFKQTAVLFDRAERFAGSTHYPLKKMLKLAMNGITSFSTVPLKLITQFGFFVSFLSFIGIAYAIFMRIFYPDITVSGWTFMVISILFIGGIQMIMLGILGTYIGLIYTEVQGRPLYIVSSVLKKN